MQIPSLEFPMERGGNSASINGEILLPEPIIQHIQSFLSGKEAAQTCILSKSWYIAWSTRPNLDFDHRDFPNRAGVNPNPQTPDSFSEFAKKTMQRYEESNLKISSLSLRMSPECDKLSLANELIVTATKMGATDLSFEFQTPEMSFVLPPEVLGSKNLTRLSAIGCRIDLGLDRKVSCSRLKYLSLRSVYIQSSTIWGIISSCPMIETLSLSACQPLYQGQNFNVIRRMNRTTLLSSYFVKFGKENLCEFHKLKCLLLCQLNIVDTMFFNDFSSKFPCVKDLTLRRCIGYKSIQISSHSLERVSITHDGRLTAEFHLPFIRKFEFLGSRIPSLFFETVSREWESDISITCNFFSISWFPKLKKFLTELSISKISLSLKFWDLCRRSFDYAGDGQGLRRIAVENLALTVPDSLPVCPAFLYGLFWSCRPKFITEYWFCEPHSEQKAKRVLDLLCNNPNRNMFDLNKVNVACSEESVVHECRLLPWMIFSDASETPERKQKCRFQLVWGLEGTAFK